MDMPAGEMPPLHVHRDEDEGFYCLGGEITLYLPGESVTLRAGDFILAPRGIPHSYEVGADGCRALVSSTPGGFERFVIAVAALDELSPEILGRRRPPSARHRDPRPSRRAPLASGRPPPSAPAPRRSWPRPAPRPAPPR